MVGLRNCVGLALAVVAAMATACTPQGVPVSERQSTSLAQARCALIRGSPPRSSSTAPQVDAAAIAAGVRRSAEVVSAIVFDRSAERYLLAEQPDRHYQSASLVKLLIALDVLARPPVDEPTRARIGSMLAASDDAEASAFWAAGGGGSIVRRMAAELGLSATPPAVDGDWGYTMISAQDVLVVYRHIAVRLAVADRELILSALRGTPRTAADGVDQHFGIPDGLPGRPWAIKQGWSSGHGVVSAHSTGLVGTSDRYVVVLMTEHRAAVGFAAAMRAATDATGMLAPLLA